MAINLQKYCDNKAMSGYGSALLYKDTAAGDSKYHLLIPLETVPSVTGSVDTFEYDLLNCTSKGKVEGKQNTEEKDVEFLWHKDNVRRLENLQGRIIDFLTVYPDMSARKFSGIISVRPNDAGADILRGTFTITPTYVASVTLYDGVEGIIQDTIGFESNIPAKFEMLAGSSTSPKTQTISCVLSPSTNTTVNVTSSSTTITGAWASGVLTITSKGEGTAVLTLTAKNSTGNTYAEWSTSIVVTAVATN